MHEFTTGSLITISALNANFKECMNISDLIKLYQLMLLTLYSGELNKYEALRVKEINFILSYLQAGELADEFQKGSRNKN